MNDSVDDPVKDPVAGPVAGPGADPAADVLTGPVAASAPGRPGVPPPVRWATAAELSSAQLYGLLRLRTDVFVVEQACPYPELDGRDLEPGCRHGWIERDGRVLSTLRLLVEDTPDGSALLRIGRVVTAADARGRGLSAALLRSALARCGAAPVVLDAQAHLEGWYGRFGFVRAGETFLEDGIPHVPMRR
ncbi:GNAT family N-acetyltransferase [Kocuria sediminis]|uniref:GNAT family N-acetyltransferase n=1 Tax=Kocuria sediminis TaxID=1038857 RepID=UPI003521D3B2